MYFKFMLQALKLSERLHVRLVLFLLLMSALSSLAQSPTPTATPVSVAEPEVVNPQGALRRLLPFQAEDESIADFRGPFSGRVLFSVSRDSSQSAQARATRIFYRLQAVGSNSEPATGVELRTYGDTAILHVDGGVLATVIPEDLHLDRSSDLPKEEFRILQREVGLSWQRELQRELDYSKWMKTGNYFRLLVGVLGLLFLGCWIASKLFLKIRDKYSAFPGLSLQYLLWFLAGILTIWLVPFTKSFGWVLIRTILVPFVAVWLFAAVMIVAGRLLQELLHGYVAGLLEQHGIRPRRVQRLQTLEAAVIKTMRFAQVVLVLGFTISILPFDFWPILTSAGVVGVAIGLAAQDFLKDIFAGISILVEDRFGVGDWIEWGNYVGEVESVDLRLTRLRNTQGGLIIIPNAELKVVNNLSNEWAQVDYRVGIAYRNDADRAIEILTEEARALAADWSEQVLAEPDVKGVHQLGPDSVVLRLFLRTKPLKQWDAERELNRRIKRRFDQEGIEIPINQRSVWLRNESDFPLSRHRGLENDD